MTAACLHPIKARKAAETEKKLVLYAVARLRSKPPFSLLDGDFDLLSEMFDFEAQGTDCNDKRTLRDVIRSAYIPI